MNWSITDELSDDYDRIVTYFMGSRKLQNHVEQCNCVDSVIVVIVIGRGLSACCFCLLSMMAI